MEIERVRSISQAAENLYIGQPNLSRILRELEQAAGFAIFERTSKGVRPTERGEQYLRHARSILREAEAIDELGPRHPAVGRFHVCLPPSSALFALTASYLASLSPGECLDAVVRECLVRQTLEYLSNGEAELGVIRFRAEYRDYFEELASGNGLSFRVISKSHYHVLLSARHPLAAKGELTRQELAELPEIVSGDAFGVQNPPDRTPRRQICVTERGARFALLNTLPGAYCWEEQTPEEELRRWDLAQMDCADAPFYCDVLTGNPQYTMSALESGFEQRLMERKTP
jgi:DNA-binding transcriptional LysR family regulator